LKNSLNSLLNSDNNQILAMSETMNKLGINQEDNHLLAAKSVLKILK